MTARILDGRVIAASIREDLKARLSEFAAGGHRPPSLQIVLVGGDEASQVYATRLQKAGTSLGIRVELNRYAADLDGQDFRADIARVNTNANVDGVLVTMPLPAHLGSEIVSESLDPHKDIDGITIVNAGNLYLGRTGHVPSTAASIMAILERSEIELKGKRAVVIGRSPVVGKPVALLLLREHATVTICHTRTRDLPSITRQADILVAAAGSPACITGDMIKPGAVVVDAGVNPIENGIVGDVEFESAVEVASAITPVPGGVGPLTTVLLLRAVMENASRRRA